MLMLRRLGNVHEGQLEMAQWEALDARIQALHPTFFMTQPYQGLAFVYDTAMLNRIFSLWDISWNRVSMVIANAHENTNQQGKMFEWKYGDIESMGRAGTEVVVKAMLAAKLPTAVDPRDVEDFLPLPNSHALGDKALEAHGGLADPVGVSLCVAADHCGTCVIQICSCLSI